LLTWHGITLGAPAAPLRTVLGDPLRVIAFDNAARDVARYWLPGSNSTYVLVVEERGYVVSFHTFTDETPSAPIETVPPDPFGVRLGQTLESVKAAHPQFRDGVDESGDPFLLGRLSSTTGVEYSFENDRVRSFQWAMSAPIEKPELAPLLGASGDAFSSAILDMQQNERDGVDWEYRYLAFHPCTQTARWKLERQSLLRNDGREYDRLHVVCPATQAEHDFYFDITNYFGKL